MHTYSISAPTISAEAERKELEQLTEEQLREIENDLYGLSTSMDETEDLLEDAQLEMTQELKLMAESEKAAYVEALKKCPDVVQRETSPLKFLRCERFHAKNAARRLVRYWEMRRRLFGPEKAFLPLTINGALRDDRETLATAVFKILPRDDAGRPVLVYERHSIDDTLYTRERVLRVLWYCLQTMSESENSQRNGFVIVANCKQYSVRHFDRKLCFLKWDTLEHASPIRLRAVHCWATPHRTTYRLVWPVARFVMGPYYRPRVLLHHGPEQRVLRTLREYRITQANLPHALGGSFSKQHYVQWLEDQRQREEQQLLPEDENPTL